MTRMRRKGHDNLHFGQWGTKTRRVNGQKVVARCPKWEREVAG